MVEICLASAEHVHLRYCRTLPWVWSQLCFSKLRGVTFLLRSKTMRSVTFFKTLNTINVKNIKTSMEYEYISLQPTSAVMQRASCGEPKRKLPPLFLKTASMYSQSTSKLLKIAHKNYEINTIWQSLGRNELRTWREHCLAAFKILVSILRDTSLNIVVTLALTCFDNDWLC